MAGEDDQRSTIMMVKDSAVLLMQSLHTRQQYLFTFAHRARWETCCPVNSLEAPALLPLQVTLTRFVFSIVKYIENIVKD